MEGVHPNRSCKHGMFKFTITVTGVILRRWFAERRYIKKKNKKTTTEEQWQPLYKHTFCWLD